MKRICTRFVYWYNLKYNRVGHLFQDRYRSEPVEDESYLVMAVVYIHQNPMKAGITKGLSYKYSSYDSYIKGDFGFVDGEKVVEAMQPFEFAEYHKNFIDARFIDVNEKVVQRKTDEDIIELLKKKYKCNSVSDFQKLPTLKRDKYVLELKKHGASLRQISRLTGISLGVVRGILKQPLTHRTVPCVPPVVTCGGFAAAAGAVAAVGSGVAAATTASTVAAGAFIGSATVYGMAVVAAASTSSSVKEFNDQGDWGTVAATAGGAIFNGAAAYAATRTPTTTVYRSVSSAEAQDIKNTGQFNLAPGGMESKQFGFNLSETRQFGNMMGQNTIVSAKVPNSMLNQLYTGGVDTSIFRAGTLTVYGDQLGAFNQAVSGTIKFMP